MILLFLIGSGLSVFSVFWVSYSDFRGLGRYYYAMVLNNKQFVFENKKTKNHSSNTKVHVNKRYHWKTGRKLN